MRCLITGGAGFIGTALANYLVGIGHYARVLDDLSAGDPSRLDSRVQERADGRWALPGGWADVGDLPSETIVREVWEETGLQVVISKLIGVYDGNRSGTPLSFYHAYKLVFLCEITGGSVRPNEEILDVAFFDFEDLPPLSSERTNPRHLAEVRAHAGEPARVAAFD